MGISPAIPSNRWGLDEWVIVIAMLLCCCCCCCGCIVSCCLRRRRRRRRREEVQRAATSPSATHHVQLSPTPTPTVGDAEPALQLNPHHAHPRRPLTSAPYACQAMQRSLDDPHDSERETKRGRKERRRSAGEEAIFTGHARGGSFAVADHTGRSSIVQIRASSARPSPPPPPPGGRRPPPPPDYI